MHVPPWASLDLPCRIPPPLSHSLCITQAASPLLMMPPPISPILYTLSCIHTDIFFLAWCPPLIYPLPQYQPAIVSPIMYPFSTLKKKFIEFLYFFLPNLSETGKPLCWQGVFWCPPEKGFFVFWGGKSVPLTAGVIFSLLLGVIFPYFPYFPIKFTGKILEDSRLATGALGRVAIKFGPFC